MTFLIIIFLSPLYFLMRKRWFGFILNFILYGIAVFLVVTVVFSWLGAFFWLLAVGHAGWYLRQENMVKQAELIAEKMVEKQKENN